MIAPGLGLLRLGQARLAAIFYLVPTLIFLVAIIGWSAAPALGFAPLLLSFALTTVSWLGSLLGSAWLSWRDSRWRPEQPRRPWSNWYILLPAGLAAYGVNMAGIAWSHHSYKPFYMPSDNMAPTLMTSDRIVALMRGPGQLKRGDVILFSMPDGAYIKRVAALPGDRIGIIDGIVVVNGVRIPQKLERIENHRSYSGERPFRRLQEQFPGEALPHEIYDENDSVYDNYPETRILPGHVFVLGDNRDNSADSRMDRVQSGVEQLPIADILGRALYYTYGPSRRTGESINPR